MDKKQKILLIDDDTDIQKLYKLILTDAGFIVDIASDGAGGLTKIQSGGYDLVLLDLMMPNVDGLQFLNTIKNNPPRAKNGPIVILTNMSLGSNIVRQAMGLGIESFLVKADLSPGQLVEKVKNFLNPTESKEEKTTGKKD